MSGRGSSAANVLLPARTYLGRLASPRSSTGGNTGPNPALLAWGCLYSLSTASRPHALSLPRFLTTNYQLPTTTVTFVILSCRSLLSTGIQGDFLAASLSMRSAPYAATCAASRWTPTWICCCRLCTSDCFGCPYATAVPLWCLRLRRHWGRRCCGALPPCRRLQSARACDWCCSLALAIRQHRWGKRRGAGG